MLIIRPEEWGKGEVLFQMWHIGLDMLVLILVRVLWIKLDDGSMEF